MIRCSFPESRLSTLLVEGVPFVWRAARFSWNSRIASSCQPPTFFVLDLHSSDCLYLLEYKCTRTPLFSSRRIEELRTKAKPGLDWQDIGQWEEAAHKKLSYAVGSGYQGCYLELVGVSSPVATL